MIRACKKSRWVTKFWDRDNFFRRFYFSFMRFNTPYFYSRCVGRATFDRNLIHSADACFWVMTCVGYSRVQLKTLLSLLKLKLVMQRNPSVTYNFHKTEQWPYNLRRSDGFKAPKYNNSGSIGRTSLSYRGSIVWNILPAAESYELSDSLANFRKR